MGLILWHPNNHSTSTRAVTPHVLYCMVCLAVLPSLTGIASAEEPPRPVEVADVVLVRMPVVHEFAGVVRPRHEAAIAFRAPGRIIERDVDIGSRVSAGEVLARLDPTDLALEVRSAEANLAAAQALEVQAQADAARYGNLVRSGNVSASENDARQAAFRTARQQVSAAEAAVHLARDRLGYAVLTAPADGIVTAVLADPGTVIAPGMPVLRIADAAAPEAEIGLPEKDLPDVSGAAVTVVAWTHPDVVMSAHLREQALEADARLGTYSARFVIDAPPPWLTLGMTVRVRMAGPSGPVLARVPASAVTDRGDGPMVWVVDPATGRLSAHPVTLHSLLDGNAFVGGLRGGEFVVSQGVQKLDPGLRVRIIANH